MINGIINVYKEKGFTSFDVVAKMRGIFHQKKIGHTGTLDPDAVGVLPVCLGSATKVCELLQDKDKTYEAVLLLGRETDTLDVTGTVQREAPVSCTEDEIRAAVGRFVGPIEQIPPMYSAIRVNGRHLYELARQGQEIERKARQVMVYSISVDEIRLPRVTLTVHCGKGTYIRSLCSDIGSALGCGGCMESLIRTRVGLFPIEEAHTLTELQECFDESWVRSVDSLFPRLEKLTAKNELSKQIDNGNHLPAEELLPDRIPAEEERFRIYREDERFIGIYEFKKETMTFKPVKLFFD